MSVPSTTSNPDARVGSLDFPVVLRGYDRQQVDSFVADLQSRLAVERRRADQSEHAAEQARLEAITLRNQPPPSFEHLGAEAARVLEQAGGSAKLLIAEARNRGDAVVLEAEGHASELVARAERRAAELEAEARELLAEATGERDQILQAASAEAEQLRRRAEEEAGSTLEEAREVADRVRQEAISEQLTMQSETERLRESGARMLDYLGRIHADLGALLAEAVAGETAARSDTEEPEQPDQDHVIDVEVADDPVAPATST